MSPATARSYGGHDYRAYDSDTCSIARTLALVGDRWTLLVLRDVANGVRRFDELADHLGIARNILSRRLAALTAAGLVERSAYHEPGERERHEYRLSGPGRELMPILLAIMDWGDRNLGWPEGPPTVVRHAGCGARVRFAVTCEEGHELGPRPRLSLEPGPGSRVRSLPQAPRRGGGGPFSTDRQRRRDHRANRRPARQPAGARAAAVATMNGKLNRASASPSGPATEKPRNGIFATNAPPLSSSPYADFTDTGSARGGVTVAKRPSSIERIQRLERLERERLEEEERREERRRAAIAGVRPSGGRHDLVDRIERVTKYPMALLGIVWLVIAIVVVTADVNGSASIALVGTLFALWVILLAEYLVRLVVTPDRRGYLKRRWVEPATVAVPALQHWHLIGIEKMCLLLQEAELRVETVLRHHSLFRVLIAAAATLLLGAWLVLLFEEKAKSSNIHSYPDALWWAVVTVTTVGYGDRFPVSEGGRVVAVILMLLGIGLIGVLTATVASVFVKEHTDANRDEYRKGHEDLGQQLSVISNRLADLERRLGATPAEVAAADPPADQGPSAS